MAAMQKKVTTSKLKNIDFSQEDFSWGKKKRKLVSTPKKPFNPLVDCQLREYLQIQLYTLLSLNQKLILLLKVSMFTSLVY